MEKELNVRISIAYRDAADEWRETSLRYFDCRTARVMGMVLTGLGLAIQEGRTSHEEVEEFACGLLGTDPETWDRFCKDRLAQTNARGDEQLH